MALVVVAAAVLVYLPSLDGDLVWDDRSLILEELRFYSPSYPLEVFAQDFFGDIDEEYRYGYYRPLVSLSYYVTWKLLGGDPLPYRVTNIVLHAAVTLLLYWLCLELFAGDPWSAGTAAVLFAVQPVHAESVAWVAGRTDVVCAVLLLAAVIALVRCRNPADGGAAVSRPATTPVFLLGVLCFGGSLFAKEMAIFWPAVLVVFALVVPEPQTRRWYFLAGVYFAVAALPYLALRLFVAETVVPSKQWSLVELPAVILTFFATVGRYLGKLVGPSPTEPYIVNPVVTNALDPWALTGVVVFGVACTLVWRWRSRHRSAVFLLVFFLLSFGPISNLVRITGPLDMGAPMAERFLYIPSLGLCALAGAGVGSLVDRFKALRVRVAVATFVALCSVVLAVRTVAASVTWHDEETLFATMVEQAEGAALPHELLGTLHCRHGRWNEAIAALQTAIDRYPDVAEAKLAAHNNLAGAYVATGEIERARSLLYATRSEGTNSNLEFHLGVTYLADGELERALRFFDRALQLSPWHPEALLRRAGVLSDVGDVELAAGDLERYLGRYGENPEALRVLAVVRGKQGREDEAVGLLRRAAALAPDDVEVATMLGSWALSVGRWEEARTTFERLLERRPVDPAAVRGAATAAWRMGDVDAASALLEDAASANPGDLEVVLLLTRIEIERGRQERARHWLEHARGLSGDDLRVVQLEHSLRNSPK